MWVLGCVAFWLLGCTWIGYRRGIVRQAVAIAALAGAWIAAFTLGPMLAPMVPALGFPVFIRPIIAGFITGMVVWVFTMITGAILFKKTEEQSFGLIRLFYGAFGAGLGLVFGISVLALAAWGIRLSGSFAEGLQRTSNVKGKTPKQAPSTVLSLKHVLDQSAISSLISNIDPLPAQFYPRIEKAGQMLSSPDAFERLLSAPEMESIIKHPKVIALREDPKFQESLKTGDYMAILRNPKVRAAASDTQLVTALHTINIERQVDLALANTPAPPKEKHNAAR